ncbi:hypothetical protein CW304_29835 [Bacillus sp. UFRGS-B20]|nr:hypothetical protein CW304_29835 [Bacillus sp. UFRGS-B20]
MVFPTSEQSKQQFEFCLTLSFIRLLIAYYSFEHISSWCFALSLVKIPKHLSLFEKPAKQLQFF